MAATPSVKVVKTSPFKGGTRRWSNRYHFSGGTPADTTHWNTLFDNIVAAEKSCFDGRTSIVECIGYAAGSDVPVASKTYSTVGTHSQVGGSPPGEVASLIRYSTDQRTSKNHPIYLFNYMHFGDQSTTGGEQDKLTTTYKTALGTYATAWISGFSDGANTYHRAGPNGAVAQGEFVEEYFTHRDFPYTPSA